MADALAPLVTALALGDGFQFLVLVVSSQTEADTALARIQRELQRRTGKLTLVARLAPSSPTTIGQLEREVLDPLAQPGAAGLVVIDATASDVGDEPAWAELFRRLNARRNGLDRVLGRPLILCLPAELEGVFIREAPDFWSIRSLRVELSRHKRTRPKFQLAPANARALAATLDRALPRPHAAMAFFAEIAFPPTDLPTSDAPDYWTRVFDRAARDAIPGGQETLLRALARRLPAEPTVAQIAASLPRAQSVDWRWVEPSRVEDYVEPSWAREVVERLDALGPGGRLPLAGELGCGRRALLAWWAARPRTGPAVWLLPDVALPEEAARQLARFLEPHNRVAARVSRALGRLHVPAELDAAAVLSPELARRLAVAPLATVPMPLTALTVDFLISRFTSTAKTVIVWDTQHRHGSGADQYPNACHVLLTSRGGQPEAFRTSSAEHLRAILTRRLAHADARTRLMLENPVMSRLLHMLATLTGIPGVYLRWVRALLETGPVPPERERLSPVGWASALYDVDPELAARAAELAAGPLEQSFAISNLGIEGVRKLVTDGVLRRSDDERLELAPLAAVLRPGIAWPCLDDHDPSTP